MHINLPVQDLLQTENCYAVFLIGHNGSILAAATSNQVQKNSVGISVTTLTGVLKTIGDEFSLKHLRQILIAYHNGDLLVVRTDAGFLLIYTARGGLHDAGSGEGAHGMLAPSIAARIAQLQDRLDSLCGQGGTEPQ